MAFPVVLAALFGKAAVGAVSKGLAAKGSAVGAKAATGHRGHHALARKVVGKIVNKATDEAVEFCSIESRHCHVQSHEKQTGSLTLLDHNHQQAATSEVISVAPTPLPKSVRDRIFIYLGILITLLAFGAPHGGLIEIPMSFLLKNKLHLQPHELANFRVVSAIPLYLSFVFGFVRDTWNPLGMKDRGFMLLFGSLCSILYVTFALTPVSYAELLVAMVLLTTSFLFVSSAQNGLASVLGQQHLMSGQVSAAWNIFASLPAIAALLIGGALSDILEGQNADQAVRLLFLCGAGIMAAVAVYSIWRSQSVFDNIANEHGTAAQPSNDLKRLAKHWPIYPALVIWLLWSFAPGSVTAWSEAAAWSRAAVSCAPAVAHMD